MHKHQQKIGNAMTEATVSTKKRYSDVEKLAIVKRFQSSGQDLKTFCTVGNNPSIATMKKWVTVAVPVCKSCEAHKKEATKLQLENAELRGELKYYQSRS
jgi:hypothetical protein